MTGTYGAQSRQGTRRDLAHRCLGSAGRTFDLIIANAGVMACPQGRTVDGFETQFGTNHLGHFVLVNRVAPLMSSGARLVILSSAGHRFADVDLEDPNFERYALDPARAQALWKKSEEMVAEKF